MDKTHYADDATLARIAELEAENARMKAERDEFYTEYRMACDKGEKDATARLLAAQLRINELRDALKSVKADLVLRAEIDSETSVAILNIGNGVLRQMNEALAAPDAAPELDALMRDAARYQWLRDCEAGYAICEQLADVVTGVWEWFPIYPGETDEDFDAAIDEAMKEMK